MSDVDVKALETRILGYLESRPPAWRWFFGKELTKEETIKRFKKDRKFRQQVLEAAVLKSINDFKV